MIKSPHSKIVLKFGGAGVGGGGIVVHVEKCLFKKQKGRLKGHLGESKDDNIYCKIKLLALTYIHYQM